MSTITYDKIDNLCHDGCAYQYNYNNVSSTSWTKQRDQSGNVHIQNVSLTGTQNFGSATAYKTNLN